MDGYPTSTPPCSLLGILGNGLIGRIDSCFHAMPCIYPPFSPSPTNPARKHHYTQRQTHHKHLTTTLVPPSPLNPTPTQSSTPSSTPSSTSTNPPSAILAFNASCSLVSPNALCACSFVTVNDSCPCSLEPLEISGSCSLVTLDA